MAHRLDEADPGRVDVEEAEEELERFDVRQLGEYAMCADPFALAWLEEYGLVHRRGP